MASNLLVQGRVLYRTRGHVEKQYFYRRNCAKAPQKLCHATVEAFSKDITKYLVLLSFYSKITCPKEGDLSPVGQCSGVKILKKKLSDGPQKIMPSFYVGTV